MNYGIWMTSAEKIQAGFETSTGADYLCHISIHIMMENGIMLL